VPVIAAAGVAILLSMLGRAATIYPVAALFGRSKLRLSAAWQHVLWWGGLRGALALALALALPASVAERGQIIAVAFALVAFSVFVQGLTMPALVKRLVLAADAGG
jgi:CPA1 family monovalent cation:H+ antiporter